MRKNEISRYKNLGPLHDLLLEACPPGPNGTRSIVVLAEKLKVSHQYVYSWIDKNQVPSKFVRPLVELGKGRVSFSQFHDYAFA